MRWPLSRVFKCEVLAAAPQMCQCSVITFSRSRKTRCSPKGFWSAQVKTIYATIVLAIVSQLIPGLNLSSWGAESILEGTVVDADKKPIPSLKIDVYDGKNPTPTPIRLSSDAAGEFQATLPFDDFSLFVRSPDQYEEIGRLQFSRSRADLGSPHVVMSKNGNKVKLLITLQLRYNAVFQLVDARSGRLVANAAVFFKEDQESWENSLEGDPDSTSPWQLYQVLNKGSIDFRERTSQVLEHADILVFATGYQPLRLKLNETLVRGRTLEKRLELPPLPALEFTVVTPDGKPAAGVVFETVPPDETLVYEEYSEIFRFKERIKHVLDIAATTDEHGTAKIESPAFGQSISYRLRHTTGYAELNPRNLKASGDTAIQHRIELNRYATFRGKYLPKIGPAENLELYRVQGDRLTRVDPAIPVPVDGHGNFDIRHLLAGWYSLGHRIHYGGRDGRANSVVLVGFDQFRMVHGQVVEVTLGAEGRPVQGRLILPTGYGNEDHLFELAVDPDINRPDYPRRPQNITDEQALIAWWDAYWNSDTGRRFANCRVQNVHTAAAKDGTFYLPFVRPGTYRISRVLTSKNSLDLDLPLTLPRTSFTIPDDGNRQVFDLGDIRILEK